MISKSTAWVVMVYGVLMILLGCTGFYLKASVVSLIMGSGFGLLLMASAWGMIRNVTWSVYCAIGLTLLLTITFAYRYSTTEHAIPAVLAVFSGGMLIYLLLFHGAKWSQP